MQNTIHLIAQCIGENIAFIFQQHRIMIADDELFVDDRHRGWHKMEKNDGKYQRFLQDAKGDWREIDTDGKEEAFIAALNAYLEEISATENRHNYELDRSTVSYNDALQQMQAKPNW